MKDEWVIILDFLPNGMPGHGRPEPIAHAIGEKFFSLLELAIRDDVELELGDRIYIGDGERDEVKYIKRSLNIDDLSAPGKEEIEGVVKDLIRENGDRFVNFFNTTQPISTRMHSLELLPGIGKKHMWEILEERRVKKFENYEDLKERCPSIPDPVKMIEKRVMLELEGKDERHRLFVLKGPSRR